MLENLTLLYVNNKGTDQSGHRCSLISAFAIHYCRFGNFRENSIFEKNIKRHISNLKNSRLRQGLPISINDRVILPFRDGFIFTKLRKNKGIAKIFEFTLSRKYISQTCSVQNFNILTSLCI